MEYSHEVRDDVKRRSSKRCMRAALAGAATTVAGVIALVATSVAPPPTQYQEASINPPRHGDERITVRVTQEDAAAMRARVTDYLDEHNIAYEIIEGAITVERAPGRHRAHLERLQSRPLQLTPNYRHWPGSPPADEPHTYGERPQASRHDGDRGGHHAGDRDHHGRGQRGADDPFERIRPLGNEAGDAPAGQRRMTEPRPSTLRHTGPR